MANTGTAIRYFEHVGTYAVIDRNGTVIEGHLPSAERAAQRKLFHDERIAEMRAWDAAHRSSR